MHSSLLILVLASAIILRVVWQSQPSSSWNQRWIGTMFTFALPPLLLITGAIALLCMGPQGMGISIVEGWGTYGAGISFLIVAAIVAYTQAAQATQELKQLRQYPSIQLTKTKARLLPIELPFIAQVGFWHPEIMVSRGLLETLNPEQFDAVLAHEQAHATYHDTFWFFSFGCLRRLTFWLPKSDSLWQELLLLRELRADRIAAQTTDPLVLAEALITLVRSPMVQSDWSATLHPQNLDDRFSERIDAILNAAPLAPIPGWKMSVIVIAGLLPLLIIPFHHS